MEEICLIYRKIMVICFLGIFGRILHFYKKCDTIGRYSRVAQWWSKKLLTSRLPVRARPREPI